MLKNIGKSDKLIRIAVAILLLAIVQFLGITVTLSVILMGLSLYLNNPLQYYVANLHYHNIDINGLI